MFVALDQLMVATYTRLASISLRANALPTPSTHPIDAAVVFVNGFGESGGVARVGQAVRGGLGIEVEIGRKRKFGFLRHAVCLNAGCAVFVMICAHYRTSAQACESRMIPRTCGEMDEVSPRNP